jgi:hypothetical protein
MPPPGWHPEHRRFAPPGSRPPSLFRLLLRLVLVIGVIMLLLRFAGHP